MSAAERGLNDATGAGRGFGEMIEQLAKPELLRDNPFRVIGLATDASNRELSREAKRLELQRRLSDGDDEDRKAAETGRIEEALRRLRDPAQRLVDELLWFWPDGVEAAPGHNAAIRELQSFTEAEPGDVVEQCELAIETMAASLGAPATVAYVTGRVLALDDPRVTADDAQRLLEEAQLLVPLVALRMAVRAHNRGQTNVAAGLVEVVRARTYAYELRDALTKVLRPVVERVHTLAETAESDTRRDRDQGAAHAERLLEQTSDDLALVDVLLDGDDPLRASLADDVVDHVIQCVVPFYNDTSDEGTAIDLLQAAGALHCGPTVRNRLDENLETIKANAETSRCWFCQAAPGEPSKAHVVNLYGDVQRDHFTYPPQVTWQTLKVSVPRCSSCAARHGREIAVGCAVPLVLVFAAIPIALLTGMPWLLLAIWAAAAVSGWKVGIQKETETSKHAWMFPLVQEHLQRGWQFGERPPGVQ